MAHGAPQEWTREEMDRLEYLWEQKLPDGVTYAYSSAEVGRLLGKTKNATVGKSHRMNLPPRPSPIKDRGVGQYARKARRLAPRVTLPSFALPAVVTAPVNVVDATNSMKTEGVSPATHEKMEITSTAAPAGPARLPRLTSLHECCFPHGQPGTASFRFCGAETQRGSPYCSKHHARCHVRMHEPRTLASA